MVSVHCLNFFFYLQVPTTCVTTLFQFFSFFPSSSSFLLLLSPSHSSFPVFRGSHSIVLDEAHVIRTRTTRQFSACTALQGDRRWCLTGTPFQNKLEDLYSLVCFMRLDPYDEFAKWRKLVDQMKSGMSVCVCWEWWGVTVWNDRVCGLM